MKRRHEFLLVTAALIWGMAFVAQQTGMAYIGPFSFVCLRSIISAATLFCISPVLHKLEPVKTVYRRRDLIIGGMLCGLALYSASIFQQIGIAYTSVGKAGFITALYVVIVPFLSILRGKRLAKHIPAAVLLAVVGFSLLCLHGSLQLQKGDLLVLISAVLFAVHIMIIDHYSPLADGPSLSFVQFLTSFILGLIPMLVQEGFHPQSVLDGIWPLLYAGVLSGGVAYTLQIIGQKGVEPAVATMLLSLESVFSVLAGALLLHQFLSWRELLGCLLIFAAVIYAQRNEG